MSSEALAQALHPHSRSMVEQHGPALRDWLLRAASMLDDQVGSVRPVLLALLLIAVLALLVACANAVNLVVLRGVARMRELGIQRALGASSGQLARSMFLETMLLGLVATVVGIALAAVALQVFVGIGDSGVPRAAEVALSLPVLVAAAGCGLLASLLAASLPAWRLRRLNAAGALRSGDGRLVGIEGSGRFLPVLACAVSVSGLAAALLLAGSVWKLERMPMGYETESMLAMQVFRDLDPGQGAYTRQLIETLRAWGARRHWIPAFAGTPKQGKLERTSVPFESASAFRSTAGCCWPGGSRAASTLSSRSWSLPTSSCNGWEAQVQAARSLGT